MSSETFNKHLFFAAFLRNFAIAQLFITIQEHAVQEEVIGKHVLLVGVFSMQSYLAFALSLVTQVLWF